MKTTLLLKSAIVALLMLCAFNKAQAQLTSPYPVGNATSCPVKISYLLFDANCNLLSSGTAPIPGGGTSITLPAGVYDIKISVVNMISPSCPVTQSPTYAGTGVCPGATSASLTTNNCGCLLSTITVAATGANIN